MRKLLLFSILTILLSSCIPTFTGDGLTLYRTAEEVVVITYAPEPAPSEDIVVLVQGNELATANDFTASVCMAEGDHFTCQVPETPVVYHFTGQAVSTTAQWPCGALLCTTLGKAVDSP